MLFNPSSESFKSLDPRSREIMQLTIGFFENKGKASIKDDDHERRWYRGFLDFIRDNQIFSTLLTPPEYNIDDPEARWDTHRNCIFNEILGFYGLPYWYTWQVSVLGLGPLWMAQGDGYRADGRKYYIGNGNEAALVSVFGKNSESGEYVFFAVETDNPDYTCVKNTVNSQMFVAEFALEGYPVSPDKLLSSGSDAWDAALNTVNIGKFNLGWASIGICTHAFYEAIHHAANRQLYGKFVTDFPHVRHLLTDAYTRLVAMRLFATRASDYMRVASPQDRRYLLYNPMVKMKVTTQGEDVIDHLWEVIAAKGFEKDNMFEMAARDIRALPKLEGTVHVNIALVVKFMTNFLFNPDQFDEVLPQTGAAHDAFLFNQGPTHGLGDIRFHDPGIAYDSVQLPNVEMFKSQIAALKGLLVASPPDRKQSRDMDFLLSIGELFTMVVYGQLILESAKLQKIDDLLLDQIFDFMVRDFSRHALNLYSTTSTTAEQAEHCLRMIDRPAIDESRFTSVWERFVLAEKDSYEMNP
jgi:acyl-CoA dehydrogenase